MAGARWSVDETQTFISNSARNQALRTEQAGLCFMDSEDVTREPSRLGYENRHAHQENFREMESLHVLAE